MPREGLLFIAVPDGAVREMASRVARLRPPRGLAVVHVSGALGLDALDALENNPRGSFHPLQSFPAPRDPSAFRGITVAIDASSVALRRRLASLARELGARPRHVGDAERVRYHAAAVFASNFVDVLIAQAVKLLQGIGWSREDATRALLPLVDGAIANIRRQGTVGALTGPIRRGDSETVERHLEALSKLTLPSGPVGHLPMSGKETYQIYRMLGLVALEIAKEAGLDPAAAERTSRALTRKVAATRRRGRT
jgi:predicted short-subunit dehydrogenase-like oxidoreductase (DUF2520 family)